MKPIVMTDERKTEPEEAEKPKMKSGYRPANISDEEWREMLKKHTELWYRLWPLSPILMFFQRLFRH
ncbi:MAG TPA: hypothetical protein VN516_03270, partial [Candidatus Baltobacteraceae bacterium]|nr:hypothetical protein [Candidatus Baltobacteraceae bacterium]